MQKVKKIFLAALLLPLLVCAKPSSSTYVGELQEAWQFPSDHLPVGATVDDFHIATWNVLNSVFMSWIEQDAQGLSRSAILSEHREYVDLTGLTLRESHTIQHILDMISHPTHPRSIIALQECGQNFLAALQRSLPAPMQIVYSSAIPVKDQNILLYDAQQFSVFAKESKIVTDAFPCNPGRPLMDIVLIKHSSHTKYRFINTHTPGDPNLPGRFELTQYIADHKRDDLVTIALGDMNFDPEQMEEAFVKANLFTFTNLGHYYTIVGIDKEARAIDHIFVDFGNFPGKIAPNDAEEVLQSLSTTLGLLYP